MVNAQPDRPDQVYETASLGSSSGIVAPATAPVSPETRWRLVAFELGNDVVGVVDACSRASDSQGACWRAEAGCLSKRIGRAERVARLHNLSADS
jgi:hypothetical protein